MGHGVICTAIRENSKPQTRRQDTKLNKPKCRSGLQVLRFVRTFFLFWLKVLMAPLSLINWIYLARSSL